MQVLAVASQKGGVGKTTLSGHLAVEAARCGRGRVAIVDTDPQGSLAAWWQARAGDSPALAAIDLANVTAGMDVLRRAGIDLVIVDTPPAIVQSIAAVIAAADLVLIPTRPSPHDLRAIGATVDMVEASHRPMVFVLNGCANRARITHEASSALSQHGPVAPVIVYQRTDFASSMSDGRTAGEIDPESKSASEIRDLWTYVSNRLNKEARY